MTFNLNIPYSESRITISHQEIDRLKNNMRSAIQGNVDSEETADTLKLESNGGVGKILLAPNEFCSDTACKSSFILSTFSLGQWKPLPEELSKPKQYPFKNPPLTDFSIYLIDLNITDTDGDDVNDVVLKLFTVSQTQEETKFFTLSTRIYNGLDIQQALKSPDIAKTAPVQE